MRGQTALLHPWDWDEPDLGQHDPPDWVGRCLVCGCDFDAYHGVCPDCDDRLEAEHQWREEARP